MHQWIVFQRNKLLIEPVDGWTDQDCSLLNQTGQSGCETCVNKLAYRRKNQRYL